MGKEVFMGRRTTSTFPGPSHSTAMVTVLPSPFFALPNSSDALSRVPSWRRTTRSAMARSGARSTDASDTAPASASFESVAGVAFLGLGSAVRTGCCFCDPGSPFDEQAVVERRAAADSSVRAVSVRQDRRDERDTNDPRQSARWWRARW